MNKSKMTDYCAVYEMPECLGGGCGAFCLGIVADGFATKEDAYKWCIEQFIKQLQEKENE